MFISIFKLCLFLVTKLQNALRRTADVLTLGLLPKTVKVYHTIQLHTNFMDSPRRVRSTTNFRVQHHFKYIF
jgi:hypothetical protein